jgi:hypothetical protein
MCGRCAFKNLAHLRKALMIILRMKPLRDFLLKFQAAFPGAVCHRLHAAVI